jgi:hypothetical protein
VLCTFVYLHDTSLRFSIYYVNNYRHTYRMMQNDINSVVNVMHTCTIPYNTIHEGIWFQNKSYFIKIFFIYVLSVLCITRLCSNSIKSRYFDNIQHAVTYLKLQNYLCTRSHMYYARMQTQRV